MMKKDLSWLDNAQTTLKAAPVPAPIATTAFRLDVVRGPDAGAAITVDGNAALAALIGTSEVVDLRLRDPEISRRHVSVEVHGAHLRVRDLGSTNGTRVNGTRVVEVLLAGSETIEIGASSISVARVEGSRALPVSNAESFGDYLGRSLAMRKLYPVCQRLAAADVPLVIEGETGTGKEALAEAIHAQGARAGKPFVIFDCTAVPGSLIEAALFGHEKGAFTGAVTAKAGVFEEADGGTLLIDEIGDLDVALQAKLLRAVQSREVQRLGGTQWLRADVRIIAATRRDLEREIQAGRFRDDLYYRLAVARIELPPLRRRRGDVALLARHFWATLVNDGTEPPEDFLERLGTYAWPGNVRELHNAVLHRVALGEHADVEKLQRSSPPPPEADAKSHDVIGEVIADDLPFPRARQKVMEAFEERYVDAVLAKNDGNVSKAAASAGIARRYFYTIRNRRGR